MLRIEILKRPDGSGLLRCTRNDGSVAWQKQTNHAAHFALHDMTHYAVETTLGYQRAFFGLIGEGWEMTDIGGKGERGPLPAEATEVERIVGVFDSERNCGAFWTTEEFNSFAPRPLTDEEIGKVRTLRAALFQRWAAITPGRALELQFEPAISSPTSVRA
jgi:hypothetical protein